MMATLWLRGVTKAEGALSILDGIDLDVGPGERLAVLGRSGSGKTTLLSILGLLAAASSGSYRFDGVDVGALPERRRDMLRARTFGFVFQRFCLMPQLSALENVEVALLHQGVPHASRRERALEALFEVGLADRTGHRPAQLSGGEQQRVAVARAVVTRPEVILADEPTGALDERTGATVLGMLHALTESHGTSLVVVTHDQATLGGFDRTVELQAGRVVTP